VLINACSTTAHAYTVIRTSSSQGLGMGVDSDCNTPIQIENEVYTYTHTHIKHTYTYTHKQPAPPTPVLRCHTGRIMSVAIAILGGKKLIATACVDNNSIKIWCADTGQVLHTLTRKEDLFGCLDFSTDGSVLISACNTAVQGGQLHDRDNVIHVWGGGFEPGCTPRVLRSLKGHTTKFIISVKISPDSQKIVSTSYDQTVRIWSVETGTQTAVCVGHRSPVNSAAWSPNSTRVASAADGVGIRVWDAASGTLLLKLKEPGTWPELQKVCLSFVSETRVLVCTSSKWHIGIYEVCEGEKAVCRMLDGHNWEVRSLALSHDNKYIASGA
jgi:WD40 repeat protein